MSQCPSSPSWMTALLAAFVLCTGCQAEPEGEPDPEPVLVSSDGASVLIPPGALDGEVDIAIEAVSSPPVAAPDGLEFLGPAFAFTPHDTQFQLPVTISLPHGYAAAGQASPEVYRLGGNDDSDWLIPDDLFAEFSEEGVLFDTQHFSYYAVMVPYGQDGTDEEALGDR